MNVNSIGGTYATTALDPTQTTAGADPDGSSIPVLGGEDARPSQRAKLMSELADLQKSDPDKFKQVTEDIAKKLREAAASAGAGQSTFLGNLADKFEQASQSGEMSALQPPSGASGHHGGHHHVKKYSAAQEGGAAEAQQAIDPAQLIQSVLEQDGVQTS